MEPFDTVSETREYLDDNPDPSGVESLLEAEEDGPGRVTAVGAIKEYLREVDTEPDTVEFRVQYPFDDYSTGDIIKLDPDDAQTVAWRQDGRIRLSR